MFRRFVVGFFVAIVCYAGTYSISVYFSVNFFGKTTKIDPSLGIALKNYFFYMFVLSAYVSWLFVYTVMQGRVIIKLILTSVFAIPVLYWVYAIRIHPLWSALVLVSTMISVLVALISVKYLLSRRSVRGG